jgi:hypothetical protein
MRPGVMSGSRYPRRALRLLADAREPHETPVTTEIPKPRLGAPYSSPEEARFFITKARGDDCGDLRQVTSTVRCQWSRHFSPSSSSLASGLCRTRAAAALPPGVRVAGAEASHW